MGGVAARLGGPTEDDVGPLVDGDRPVYPLLDEDNFSRRSSLSSSATLFLKLFVRVLSAPAAAQVSRRGESTSLRRLGSKLFVFHLLISFCASVRYF